MKRLHFKTTGHAPTCAYNLHRLKQANPCLGEPRPPRDKSLAQKVAGRPRPCPRGYIRPCDLRHSHIPNDTMKTNPIGHFPSGQPILPVRQADRSPKRVFVLGVYASAVHARWISPEGRTRIAALAVASEPEIFWPGLGAE